MQKEKYCYLIYVQFLGFRFSGWQKQPHQKTIEGMIHKTLKFILPNIQFKILGAGRTDAKVSALEAAFELFVAKPLDDLDAFLVDFNTNLPSDIRVLSCAPVDDQFNIIKDSKIKEYCYLFSFGEKNHPFCAPFLTNIIQNLDITSMKQAALLFAGIHDFRAYTVKENANKEMTRAIISCEIIDNELLKANFFPKQSYMLKVVGKGFMRYQIRMIMGALFQVGKGELQITAIEESLKTNNTVRLTSVAPGSGLLLHKIDFN